MEILAYKSPRIAITNALTALCMVILTVLIALSSLNKMLILLPACIMLINILMIGDYFLTPQGIIALDGDELVIFKSFKREERIKISLLNNCIYNLFSKKSATGSLMFDIKASKPKVIHSVKDVINVRTRIVKMINDYQTEVMLSNKTKGENNI